MGAKNISPLGPAAAMEIGVNFRQTQFDQAAELETNKIKHTRISQQMVLVFPQGKTQGEEGVCKHTHTSATSRERVRVEQTPPAHHPKLHPSGRGANPQIGEVKSENQYSQYTPVINPMNISGKSVKFSLFDSRIIHQRINIKFAHPRPHITETGGHVTTYRKQALPSFWQTGGLDFPDSAKIHVKGCHLQSPATMPEAKVATRIQTCIVTPRNANRRSSPFCPGPFGLPHSAC